MALAIFDRVDTPCGYGVIIAASTTGGEGTPVMFSVRLDEGGAVCSFGEGELRRLSAAGTCDP